MRGASKKKKQKKKKHTHIKNTSNIIRTYQEEDEQ